MSKCRHGILSIHLPPGHSFASKDRTTVTLKHHGIVVMQYFNTISFNSIVHTPIPYTTPERCHQIKYLAAQFTAHLLKTSCKSELCVHKVLTKLRNMHMLDTTLFTHSYTVYILYLYSKCKLFCMHILLTFELMCSQTLCTRYVYCGCVANMKDILVLSCAVLYI